ncbi:hypothetical protein [Endozoicomonas euniceicola]|uniref:Uncharacterized protein n=1 Tax=Endozoicomonas euniceicola TaxID=1234143 RepID=A0ABY6GU47_9GAMM|nr:hypothetical protein [Endozoicomonas euniceicola]UYM16082.1 hypothetical protein NX720_25330 [Endozoicomonas euniceicola]
MNKSKLFVRTIFSFFFIHFSLSALFNSSLLFAASDSVVCETVGDLTSGFSGKAFLTDSRQVCFKTVDDNRAVFTPPSASSLFYFLSTVLSAAGSAGVVFSGRFGDVWSHKNQWLTGSPSQASVLETLLKNRLIPDAFFFREVNDRKRNRLEGELERAIANWQQLVKKSSYPAVAISVSDASMRVVITRSDILRGTSLASLYEELINIQTQSYLALLDTEALNDIAGIVTGGLVASGSGGDGDDNDSTHYSFDAEPDAEPLVMVYDDSEYPAQDSAEELITKNQENKRRLLKVLRKKIQQAIALGHGDLARILDNRVMLIEADLEHLNDLETSSAGITENDQGSPGILSFLMASLVTDNQELQQRDDKALIQALSQYSLGTDYQSVLIVSSELTHEEVLFYDRWQNTATGLVYQALKRRLVQQLQSETDDINMPTQQTESLISGLKALVHQFREMFSADLSSRYDGRQVPHQGKHKREQESNAAPAAGDGQEIRVSRNTHTNIAFQSYERRDQEGDEGDEPPRKKVHTGSKNCPLCNHGVCSQKVSEADGSGLTTAEENEKLQSVDTRPSAIQPYEPECAKKDPQPLVGTLDLDQEWKREQQSFVAACFSGLTPESPVGTNYCGLTFSCQTQSWINTELKLSFTSCDLEGNPKNKNDIGVQIKKEDGNQSTRASCSCKDYQDNYHPIIAPAPGCNEFQSYHQDAIIEHSIKESMSLVFNSKEAGHHQLRLGILDEHAAFSMKLRLRTWFEGEFDCPAGLVPRQLLLFVTTRDFEKDGRNAGNREMVRNRAKPLTRVATIAKGDEEVIIHGEDSNGDPKTHFNHLAEIWLLGMFCNAVEEYPSEAIYEIQNRVRVLITPAVVFAPETDNMETPVSSATVRDSHSDNSDNQDAIARCSGLGALTFKSSPPRAQLKLLPGTLIDIRLRNAISSPSYNTCICPP